MHAIPYARIDHAGGMSGRHIAAAPFRAAAALLAGAFRAIRYRRAAMAVRDLPPEMLKDIGIHQSEIDSVVRHGRTGRPPLMRPEP
ncbi:DUF1127 domain-containing protein [Alsobacter sp. SYSU M60028]|uniref:DUF1127 domain-containing protein n=1 Tax=Alsobacter ponti TaxID=2962936 RepID=A0ABT1L7Z7_9HYPH|nr:DUF1127 domain-containing protein [Alsobacter ponti]MCP8937620.1 DUF1127 domain-containing protein [Alsobacter ponti]